MSKNISRFKLIIDVALFIVASGFAGYFSENHEWVRFSITIAVCTGLYLVLRLSETPVAEAWIKRTVEKQNVLAFRAEKFGLVSFYNMQDAQEKDQRNTDTVSIIREGTSFALSGSTGASYVDPGVARHWDAVQEKLEAGCEFRLLITDPFCDSKLIRNKLNGVTTVLDPKLNLPVIAQLKAKYPNRFHVKFTKEIYCSVFFTEKEMMYDPYHLGTVNARLENQFVAFRFENMRPERGESYYTQLRKHFEFLWDAGQDFDQLIAQHKDKLAGMI